MLTLSPLLSKFSTVEYGAFVVSSIKLHKTTVFNDENQGVMSVLECSSGPIYLSLWINNKGDVNANVKGYTTDGCKNIRKPKSLAIRSKK